MLHTCYLHKDNVCRNVLGTKNLSEIPSERESISHVMQVALDEATDPWGVKVGCLMFLLGMDQPE